MTEDTKDPKKSRLRAFGYDIFHKVSVALATSLVLAACAGIVSGIVWLNSNIVFAADLTAVAEMVSAEVSAKLDPIAEQTKTNTDDICNGRKSALKAAIRDLRVEIHEMETAKAAGPWDTRDEELLIEWHEDLEEAEGELDGLACK